MSASASAALTIVICVLSACSDEAPPQHASASAAGTSDRAGASSGGATAGGGAGGAGIGGGSAGMAPTIGGMAGSAGGIANQGGSALGGNAGMGGATARGLWGPDGPKKQWVCPPGPFPDQQLGEATNVCVGLQYNYEYNEGPTWIASQNAFFFSNFKQGKSDGGDIIKYTLGGACEVWLHDVGCNGLAISPSGQLLAACHGPRAVVEYDVSTKQSRIISNRVDGQLLDSPNDLIARSDGNVYFSNTTYELGNRPQGVGFALLRIDPLGVTTLIERGSLNGIALSPDETKLHVVGKGTWSLDTAGNPSQKGDPSPGGDGIAVDCAGNIKNTGTNSAYGGPDGKTLLAVGGGTSARTFRVTVPGLP